MCSICSIAVPDYQPRYDLDKEIDPAYEDCKDGDDSSCYINDRSFSNLDNKLVHVPHLTPKGFNFRPTKEADSSTFLAACAHTNQCITPQT